MKKIVCLRDDDLSFFTDFSKVEDSFEMVLGEVPITFATIPFVHGSVPCIINKKASYSDIVTNENWIEKMQIIQYLEYVRNYPIGDNEVLVGQIKEQLLRDNIEIAQHGVTHRYDSSGSEMQSNEIGIRYIREGKEYLEKLFDTKVKVFVPPSNSIDSKCVEYINLLNMDLLCCGSIKFSSELEKVRKGITHPISTTKILFDRVKKISTPIKYTGGYCITGSLTLNVDDNVDCFMSNVMRMLDNFGAASIASHYWYFEGDRGGEYKKKYAMIIELLRRQYDIEFLKASDYIERIKDL